MAKIDAARAKAAFSLHSFRSCEKNEARKARGFGDLAKIDAARAKAAELAPSGLRHRCFLTPLRHRFFNANPLKAE
ncbi:MAG: hypothetical protein II509_05630, partial [Prevotella sp.]|nr:hypothetical protein [Prevotella sp.]